MAFQLDGATMMENTLLTHKVGSLKWRRILECSNTCYFCRWPYALKVRDINEYSTVHCQTTFHLNMPTHFHCSQATEKKLALAGFE